MRYTTLPLSLALAAALLAACDKKPTSPPKPQSDTTVAAAKIPSGILNDPSLPPASEALNEPASPAAAAQDTAPAQPTGGPTPKEEAAFESLVQKHSEAR